MLCRVDPVELVRVVLHPDTAKMLHDKGPVQAAALALGALGTFGAEATIFRRCADHAMHGKNEAAITSDDS